MSGKVIGAKGRGLSAEISIDGLEATLGALRGLEPDVLKRLQAELRAAVRSVGVAATAAGPPGHTLTYTVRSSQRGKRAGMKIIAADRDTAIFEFAGTKGLSRIGGPITPQGAAMVKWLDGFGKPGRFLWGAWDKEKDVVDAHVRGAMASAEHELQAHLNAAGETF